MWVLTMDKLTLFVAFIVVHQSVAEDVIYRLDAEEIYRMPTKNRMDRFEPCVGVSGGVFCTAHADLVSDEPNELLNKIRAYSAHDTQHFNFSNILYGLCITKTCAQFHDGDGSEPALLRTTEACLNHTLHSEYGLKARVTSQFCVHHGMEFSMDALDMAAAALMLLLLALNLAGTVYGMFKDESTPGNKVLMAFSLTHNCKRLVAPPSSDPRQVQLRTLNGIRIMTAILVILGHVPIPSVIGIENPSWLEWAYRNTLYHILFQGHLITLTFFIMSGMLLAYNLEVQAERRKLSPKLLPAAILSRFLRLSPVSWTILLISATLIKFVRIGPCWYEGIGREVEHCRNYWFYNLLFINNLVDHNECNLQMWSLASDMQLHVIGLAVVLLSPTKRVRNWTLGALYVLGVVWPAYHVYTKDLDGTLLATPSTISTFFLTSNGFNYVYKRTYSNLPCFVMGMAAGYLIYDLQKKNLIRGEHKKYRYAYWMLFPTLLCCVLTSYFLFFQEGPRQHILVRVLFAPIIKPLFGFIILAFIFGSLYKVESIYRSIFEWGGWLPLTRISYCMYAVHVTVVRYLAGTKDTLAHFSLFHLMHEYTGTVVLTMLAAVFMYLFVETPFVGLVMAFTPGSGSKASSERNGVASNGKATNGHASNGKATNGHASNGKATNGYSSNGKATNGHASNGKATNGLKRE